jgi:hypothetical protein
VSFRLASQSASHETVQPDADGGRGTAEGPGVEKKRRSRRWFASPVVGWLLWSVNLLSFAAICVWILVDGRFPQTVDVFHTVFLQRAIYPFLNGVSWFTDRLPYLALLGLLAIGSGVGVFVCLFFGARAHRRLRMWFAFTVLAAAWLTLGVTWREMAWQSQRFRLQSRLSGLDSIAASLLVNWPAVDGEHPELGLYMAYPQGDPSMLLLLTTPKIGRAEIAISGIEKSASGGLRFQLAGSESGSWLEWYPAGTKPESFQGGLMTQYQLERSAPLADGWYLVRYRESF